jgi:hypothetical protein
MEESIEVKTMEFTPEDGRITNSKFNWKSTVGSSLALTLPNAKQADAIVFKADSDSFPEDVTVTLKLRTSSEEEAQNYLDQDSTQVGSTDFC